MNVANKLVPHTEVVLAAKPATPLVCSYYKCNVSYRNIIGIHYIVLIVSTPLHLKYCMNMSLLECSGDGALRFQLWTAQLPLNTQFFIDSNIVLKF